MNSENYRKEKKNAKPKVKKFRKKINIHLSIHFLYPLNPSVGSQGGWSLFHLSSGGDGVHTGQVASPSQGHTETNETNNHPRSHSLLRTILESAGVPGENPRIHGENMQTPHRKAPGGERTWNPLDNHHTTVQPRR